MNPLNSLTYWPPIRRRLTGALLAGWGAASAWAWVGCDDARSHPFSARRFDPDRECLAELAAIEVVEGPDPGLGCELTCLSPPEGAADASAQVFVSTMCKPFPTFMQVDGIPTLCARARLASGQGIFCLPDGGRTGVIDSGLADSSGSDPGDSGANDAAATGD